MHTAEERVFYRSKERINLHDKNAWHEAHRTDYMGPTKPLNTLDEWHSGRSQDVRPNEAECMAQRSIQQEHVTQWYIEKADRRHGHEWSIRVVVHFMVEHIPYHWKVPIRIESTDRVSNFKEKCKDHLLAIFPSERGCTEHMRNRPEFKSDGDGNCAYRSFHLWAGPFKVDGHKTLMNTSMTAIPWVGEVQWTVASTSHWDGKHRHAKEDTRTPDDRSWTRSRHQEREGWRSSSTWNRWG